jgi:putative peptidoglycan lipid II flippase
MALIRFAATVGGYTLASRVLGFLRDVLIARYVGAGMVSDAFFVAFKLPNLFRRLFAEGAFNLAFVPLFAGRVETSGQAPARAFAEDALAVLLWALVAVTILAEIAMPWLMYAFAPGFSADPAKFDLAVALTRLTFPYLLMVSLVSLLGGVLNSVERFAAAASAPILLNLCLIAGLVIFGPRLATPGHALAWAVAVAGIVQFLWLAWNCQRAGLLPALPRPRLTPGVRRLLVVMAPAAVGAGVQQLNLFVDVIIASLLPTGAVSFLYYADRVVQLPLGVVGVALGTALLPTLSRRLRAGEAAAAAESQSRAIEFAMLLILPAAAALITVAGPIITVLFERGAFEAADSAASAGALMAFAAGLPAFVLIKVLAPGYFAREDTRTPLKVAAACLVANVVLNLILIWPLAHVGIALASSLSSWLNVALLSLGLARRGHLRLDSRLRARLPRTFAASAGMAACLWLAAGLAAPWLAAGLAAKVAALAALVGVGLAAFALFASASGALRLGEVAALLRK